MPHARWITETIKNEINKKNILSHEYKSILEDTAKLQKETEYKQQKMVVVSWLKNQKFSILMKHSIMLEKILKTPGTNYRQQYRENRSKQMQFPEPLQKCQHLQQLFLQQQGRKRTTTWNRGIRPMDLIYRLSMREHINGSRESPRCGVPNPYKRQM